MSASHGAHKASSKGFGVVLLIAVIITAVFGIRHFRTWSAEEAAKAPPKTVSVASSDASASSAVPKGPPVVMYVRKPLTAPASTADWSEWNEIPTGYRPISCEANADLSCSDTESDVTKIGYVYQCKDLRGEAHDWTAEACKNLVAFRVKSKSDKALELAWWFEPY